MSAAVSEVPAGRRLTPRQWALVITASIGALLEIIDTSITNVALISIQANLGTTLAEVGWVVTGYATASMVATMASLAQIGPDTGADALWWPLLFRVITTVMLFLPLSLATLGPLPKVDVGAGSGFYNLTRQLGGSLGIALLTIVLDHQRAVHRSHLVESLTASDPRVQERLAELQIWLDSRSGAGGSPAEQALQILSLQVDHQATLLAYGDVFRLVGMLFVAVIPLVCFLGRPQPSSS